MLNQCPNLLQKSRKDLTLHLINIKAMKKRSFLNLSLITLTLMATAIAAGSCAGNSGSKQNQPVIGKSNIQITDGRLTPEVLWAMGRIGSYSVSPDGSKIAYDVAYYSVEQNASHRIIYVMNADGTNVRQLTTTADSESSPTWIKGGSRIAFLSNNSGCSQIWEMDSIGGNRRQLSFTGKSIDGFLFAPDECQVLMVMGVPNPLVKPTQYEDLPKATGRIATDMMFRHWDSWVDELPHPFVAPFDGERVSDVTLDILEGQAYESPMLPFGGIEQLCWSPDSRKVAYTCRKKTGLEYSKSTDSDIYLYDIHDGYTENICKKDADADRNMGYDTNPQYSPDGNYIAWQSMEHDGYESDRNRLYVMDLRTGTKKSVSESFDSNVEQFIWSQDGTELYFIGAWHGRLSIFKTSLDGQLTTVNDETCDYNAIAWAGPRIIAARQSMTNATELYSVDPRRGLAERITHENDHIFNQLDGVRVEERWIPTTDGQQMLTWVIYPPKFDPDKKYPALLFCEGGPQSIVSQFWSYRWNMRIMAANGYIVVAPNRRGLPGFGSGWNEEISGDYGGQCMKDLLTAIDQVSKEPFIDNDRLGCVGASFGGYSVYWLAGHHDKRFKAFIAHDGIFNLQQQSVETEEFWFTEWDLGGEYWVRNDKTARSFATSPHLFIDKWDTPILCIHGERDYRILYSQAVSAFNSAILRGVPAELLLFPDENHWVLKPQNGVLWQRTYFDWLDRWLK